MENNNVNPGAETGAAEQNPQTNPGEQNEETRTYTQEDVNKLLQAESDRRVQQALKTFKEKELPSLLQQAQTEAEKLSKMTAEQKVQHDMEQREKALAEREAKLTRSELRAEARGTLIKKGLPAELADLIPCDSAEICSKGLETMEAAFGRAVTAAVNDRLRQPPPGAGAPANDITAALRKAAGLT